MRIHRLAAIVAAVLAAACSGGPSPEVDEALQRDLQEASGAGLELAPRTGGLDAVSELERIPAGRRAGSGAVARGGATTPVPTAAPAAQSTVARAPDAVPTSAGADVSTRPRPIGQTPARQGPYKTVGEVIRDAPFPIHP